MKFEGGIDEIKSVAMVEMASALEDKKFASVEEVIGTAGLHWWHVAHLRLFVPATDADTAGVPSRDLERMIRRTCRQRSTYATPALTLVPVTSMPPNVRLSVQLTAHDPLKIGTERWVRALDH